jgi:hypothetical protein
LWARIPEQVAGGLTFKPPRNDINAPDLYIPLMGFWSYVLAASTLQAGLGWHTHHVIYSQYAIQLLCSMQPI